MNKQTQDLAWACLPKEARDRIKIAYKSDYVSDRGYQPTRGMEVLQGVFGPHNLTSDTEPEEMLSQKRAFIMAHYSRAYQLKCDEDEKWAFAGQEIEEVLYNLFGNKCIPDQEPSVQVEPKFGIGQRVRVIDYDRSMSSLTYYKGKICTIVGIKENGMYKLELADDRDKAHYVNDSLDRADDFLDGIQWAEHFLEPYAEPENTMEEKELNLCERLKGCEGEEFYSLIDGDVKLKEINDNGVICQYHSYHLRGHLFGCSLDGVCQLYPSRALYEKYPLDAKKAWDEWASERKPKVKLHVSYEIIQGCLHGCGDFPTLEFCTDKEAKQAVEAVRECLMKFYKDNTQP